MEDDVKIKKPEEMTKINIRISVEEKKRLQNIANMNSDGNLTALIIMLANREVIMYERTN